MTTGQLSADYSDNSTTDNEENTVLIQGDGTNIAQRVADGRPPACRGKPGGSPNAPVMCALEAAPSNRVPYQSSSVLVVARGDTTVVRP
jgi:hypothetical protein